MNRATRPADTPTSLWWYTPAESWQSWRDMLGAVTGNDSDLPSRLAATVGSQHGIIANNAKSLLYLLLKQLYQTAEPHRNEVLIPGYTCYTVAASIAKAGLRIRTYDVSPLNLQADINSLQAGINTKTLAVISQHLFGIASPVQQVQQIATDAGIYHIEDAAQAFGARCEQAYAGTTGDYGLYSMGRGKALAVGGGGALVSRTDPMQALMPAITASSFRPILMSIATRFAASPLLYGIAERLPLGLGETCFEPEFEAATMPAYLQQLAITTLQRLPHDSAHRNEMAAVYSRELDVPCIQLDANCHANYTRFPVMTGTGDLPKELYRLGVRRMYPQAIADVADISPHLAEDNAATPLSRSIASSLITLPTHRRINADLAQQIAEVINHWRSD